MNKISKTNNTRKGKRIVPGSICGVIAIAIVVLVFSLMRNKERVVGIDIVEQDITEFFYTVSSSSYPPAYQRYRFYKEDGACQFYHEKREGSNWPLTESNITLSGSMELSEEQWKEFVKFLEGGTVKKREESVEAGNSGPWLYLYWNGDQAKYQEFSFSSIDVKKSFEEFCAELVMLN